MKKIEYLANQNLLSNLEELCTHKIISQPLRLTYRTSYSDSQGYMYVNRVF